jgi:hypothetical protein
LTFVTRTLETRATKAAKEIDFCDPYAGNLRAEGAKGNF